MQGPKLNYTLHEKPRSLKDAFGYTLQFLLAVLTATILIATICGTPIAAGLVAAGIGTLTFLCITKFRAPIVISNSGATVSAVLGAIALSGSVAHNYTGVVIGGAVIAVIYSIAALLIKKYGTGWLTRLMPPVIGGTTILVIGANLATFIPTYAQIGGEYSVVGALVTIVVGIAVACFSHYGKGLIKSLPFLAAIIVGYILCVILNACGIHIVDFDQFHWTGLFAVPDFAFLHLDFANFDWSTLPTILASFGLVSLAAMTEHIGDMAAATAVTGYDLLNDPGLHRTLLGDGIGSLMGTLVGAQPNTTYSEYTSTVAISKNASTWFTMYTAIGLILLGFIAPFNEFLMALPMCVFAGISVFAYGMIALAGLRTLRWVSFEDTRNQLIFAGMITTGVSGLSINYGHFTLSGIALSMAVGMVLNLILKKNKDPEITFNGDLK